MENYLDDKGFYIEPKVVYKCPVCGSDVIRLKPLGSDYCTKKDCPFDTSG